MDPNINACDTGFAHVGEDTNYIEPTTCFPFTFITDEGFETTENFIFEFEAPPIAPEPYAEFNSTIEKELLKVVDVDLKIAENAKAHNTKRYEHTQARDGPAPPPTDPPYMPPPGSCWVPPVIPRPILEPCLVVRRGEPIDIVLKFDRPFEGQKDDIQLIFEYGDDPRESRGTRVVLQLSAEDEPKKWGAKVVSQEGETLTMRIFTPPNVAVRKWKLSLYTVIKVDGRKEFFRHRESYPVYILFNPWCADDQVFMSDESWKKEYVLNDTGRIFQGTQSSISAAPWNFGQFEDFVLDLSMLLLDRSQLPFNLLGSSVQIVRKISALMNVQDDDGVLVGNWSGDYSGGTSPSFWNGSVAILEEYWKTRKPVRYGQCWVYSGLVTSICRALGIPCRSVSNFQSAHDKDGSLTIDSYYDIEGERIKERNNEDSIWNFHVWNEVWMTRPDLPDGYGGWQVIDATPQEISGGVYCAGPASVEAIKQGLIQLPYDGTFIFAEVNADFVQFQKTRNNAWAHYIQPNYVGKCISTKGPDGDDRLDITNLYKFPEGSKEERTAVFRAAANCPTRKTLYRVKAEDVSFDLRQKDTVAIGEPFDVVLKVHNKNAKERRTVNVALTLTTVLYTGVTVATIKFYKQTIALQPNAAEEVKMTVELKEYVDQVSDSCHMKMSSMCQVEETKQFHCAVDDFTFRKPTIQIKAPLAIRQGEECEFEVFFTNPLPKTLTECFFGFEAPNLRRPIKVSQADIPPNGVAKSTTKLSALKKGRTELIVGFWSKELTDLTGSAKIRVVKAKANASDGIVVV